MRVSPSELRAVRTGGVVARYAVLGAAVFVIVELPDGGTAGTAVEETCRLEHWGLVLRGELSLDGRRPRTFPAGTAFYVAPGVVHRFHASSRAVVAGFTPADPQVSDSPDELRARGIEVLQEVGAPDPPPTEVRVEGRRTRTARAGHIETEAAVMGDWLFTRSTFGPRSGYAQDWCDLPHWGLVLDGSLILHWENGDLELLGPGDAFYCPAGPPGHRTEVADVCTIVDYTPLAAIDDPGRRRAKRMVAARGRRGHGAQQRTGVPDPTG